MAVHWTCYSLIPSFCERSLKQEVFLSVAQDILQKFCKRECSVYGDQKHCREAVPCMCAGPSPDRDCSWAPAQETWDFLFLHHSCSLAQLSSGAWQQHFLMPKWEQTIYRYLHLEHLLCHRRVKTLNNNSAHINSYKQHPLLCSGNIRMSQNSTDCQRLFHRQVSHPLFSFLLRKPT